MNDLIRRQDAIDALMSLTVYKSKREIVQAADKHENTWIGGVAECIDEIEDLPSAQHERKTGKWIKVNERGCKMKIMICGIPHKVLEVDNAFNVDTHFGQIDYADAVIKINAGMPPELKKATLFHEVLHGWLVHLGYGDLTQDEKFVSSLSNAIYQSCDFKEGGVAD